MLGIVRWKEGEILMRLVISFLTAIRLAFHVAVIVGLWRFRPHARMTGLLIIGFIMLCFLAIIRLVANLTGPVHANDLLFSLTGMAASIAFFYAFLDFSRSLAGFSVSANSPLDTTVQVLGAAVFFNGLVAIAGHRLGVALLYNWSNDSNGDPGMAISTAISMLMIGTGMFLLGTRRGGGRQK